MQTKINRQNEEELDALEANIPSLVQLATQEAYIQALKSGYPVLIAENGIIVEVSLDGSKKRIESSRIDKK